MTYYSTGMTVGGATVVDYTNANSDATWNVWVSSATNAITAVPWNSWVTTKYVTSTQFHLTGAGGTAVAPPPPPSPEQIARRVEAERQHKLEIEKQKREIRAAQRRALKLLYQLIGRRAYAVYKKHGHHDVIAHSGKRYRLEVHQRVREMVGNFGDKIAAYYCIHSSYEYGLPPEDILIQQLLLLMAGDEGEKLLIKTANKTVAAA